LGLLRHRCRSSPRTLRPRICGCIPTANCSGGCRTASRGQGAGR
jgi:hypothetical protein